jgi:DNA repair protein RadC
MKFHRELLILLLEIRDWQDEFVHMSKGILDTLRSWYSQTNPPNRSVDFIPPWTARVQLARYHLRRFEDIFELLKARCDKLCEALCTYVE